VTFLRRCLVACLLSGAALLGAASSASAADWTGALSTLDGLRVPAAVRGPSVSLSEGKGRFSARFWPGVDLGATVPGSQPGEVAPTRADYARWLDGIGRLGAKVVRIYTVLRPGFYDALGAYNRAHPQAPLHFIQGVWVPEDEFIAAQDAYAPAVTRSFESEMDDAVAVVHGMASLPQRPGHAGGRYRSDVSRWLLAWSPGVEWDAYATKATDDKHAGLAPYQGRYITATPDASPMESWIAARLDHLASVEAAHGWSRPMTFTNWLTADPLSHPQEPLAQEDLVAVDATHLHATAVWPGGFFASYHAYPYYPDFLGLEPTFAAAPDPYLAYLKQLRAYHGRQAVMVTEFAVPTGLGSAHRGSLGRGQGDHSELEAAHMDAAMMGGIRGAGYAGGIMFEWIDEWFKGTWNTQDTSLPADRRQLWHNVLTNEAQFGIVAADPGRRATVVLDGKASEWSRNGSVRLLRGSGPVRELRAAHDAAYLYLLVRRRANAALQLGFDVRPGGNRGLPGRPGVDPDADVALNLARHSSTIDWAAWVDPIAFMYGVVRPYVPVKRADLVPDSGAWVTPRLIQNRPYTVPNSGGKLSPTESIDLGAMRWGRDPEAGGGDDRVLADGGPTTVELRIPWALLTIADPSSRKAWVAHMDGSITTRPVPRIGVAVAPAGKPAATARPFSWHGWNRVQWHERRKAGWPILARAFARAAR
jgi:hypothetical protein